MIELQLDETTLIYKNNIDFNSKFNKQVFIDKLKIIDGMVQSNSPIKGNPGRQSSLSQIYTPELNFINTNIFEMISKQFGVSDDFGIKNWVFYSNSDNIYSGYHTHETLNPKPTNELEKLKTDYTFTYYLQMPDNLKNDEGKLFFRTKTNKEIGILPEENDVFIFPADLEHRPEINPNSTKPRIVIAGNVAFFNNHLRKTEKTFL